MRELLLLLIPSTSYKAAAFMEAAERAGLDILVGVDRLQALESRAPGHTLTVDLRRPERGLAAILEFASTRRPAAVVGVDDETTVLAAMASQALGLRHNPIDAVRASRDKYRMRRRLAAAGMRGPEFRAAGAGSAGEDLAQHVRYPCVLKPLFLSASRGVLRANDPREFVEQHRRIAEILKRPEVVTRDGDPDRILVEDYLPGVEVAVEGLLEAGRLRLLALFDKPDPLTGPTFEETLFITPSRLPREVQTELVEEVARGCSALGLREGPVHAELRVHAGQATLLELAARTIGGLCSRTLRFGLGISLEEIVVLHAVGRSTRALIREKTPTGVMMMPIPRAGILRAVRGIDQARSMSGVDDVVLSLPPGSHLEPLPEGNRYLGFIFARGDSPAAVERTLRAAHAGIDLEIDP